MDCSSEMRTNFWNMPLSRQFSLQVWEEGGRSASKDGPGRGPVQEPVVTGQLRGAGVGSVLRGPFPLNLRQRAAPGPLPEPCPQGR